MFLQHFGDLMPQCIHCGWWSWGAAWLTLLTWSLSPAAQGKESPRPWIVRSVCWHLETQCAHSLLFDGSLSYGGLSGQDHLSQRWTSILGRNSVLGPDQCCLNTALKKNVLMRLCDAHKRFCFCFVTIAVTAILCESKLWLWPEMTPVGDGCHKKEAVSVELASARSRTQRAMEEVDF